MLVIAAVIAIQLAYLGPQILVAVRGTLDVHRAMEERVDQFNEFEALFTPSHE